jgi:ArsR family transcriptional regulator
MDSRTAVPALAALAQPSRLAVFRWLVEVGPEGACPGDIAERLQIPAATLSFHLKSLAHAGLVESDRDGRYIRYRANFALMRALVDFLSKDCCGGDPSKCAPSRARAPRRLAAKASAGRRRP